MNACLIKKILKWTVRIFLVLFAVLLIGIAIAVNFVFTPAKLTPVVQKTAASFLNADVHFGKIELTFFSTFPDFGLKMTDATVISGVFRDATQMPASQDSLMQVKTCLVTVNPMAYLLKNRIEVKDFVIEEPRIHAFVDTAGVANWNIVKADSAVTDTVVADTLVSSFDSRVKIKNVRIRNGNLVLDDRGNRIYARITGLDMGLDGFLGARRAKLKLDLSTRNILFWQEGNLLVNHLAFGLETEMKVNRDSMLYTLDRAVFDVNGIKFGAGGILRRDTVQKALLVDMKYGIHIPSLKTILDLVPDNILSKTENVDVRGEVLCEGTLRGLYGKQKVPVLTTCFKIKDGYIAYPGMPSKIDTLNMDLDAVVDLQREQPSYLKLEEFCMKGGNMDIDMEGNVEELLTDPVIKLKVDADIDIAGLTQIFPLANGVTCEGKIKSAIQTNILLSDIKKADYGKIKIGGWCKVEGMSVFIPHDSIVLKMKSGGLRFNSNQQNRNTLQGRDLLNGVVGYSGLDVNIRNIVKLRMDTTYLTLKTSPLRDTSAIASINTMLHLGRTIFIVRDTLLVGLKGAVADVGLMPSKRDKKVPVVEASIKMDSLRLRMLGNRLSMVKADVNLRAVRASQQKNIWLPTGSLGFSGLRAYTPYFPLRLSMPGTRIVIERNRIVLDSAVMKLGHSNVKLTGDISNLGKAFFKGEELKANLSVRSKMIDCNQLMSALDAGTAYAAKVEAGFRDTVSVEDDDMDFVPVVSDSVSYKGSNSVFVVPAGIDLTFQMDIDRVLFGKLVMDSIHGEMIMKDQCVQLTDLDMRSSSANMCASAIYRATDTIKAYTGFALKMNEIRVDSLVSLIPSLDTLFPMLRSFEGVVDFHISADAWLDSTMMIDLPTLRAMAYLDGKNMVLMDGETFSEISKMLMFKNKKRNMIDSISVDLRVKDGTMEIFPFMVEIDRYKAAIGGKHNLDMTFNYHVSLLKSPLPFRAGVDISGSLEKMKFRITKAKYKDVFMPSRKTQVDTAQLNLRAKMREMLRGGI